MNTYYAFSTMHAMRPIIIHTMNLKIILGIIFSNYPVDLKWFLNQQYVHIYRF